MDVFCERDNNWNLFSLSYFYFHGKRFAVNHLFLEKGLEKYMAL